MEINTHRNRRFISLLFLLLLSCFFSICCSSEDDFSQLPPITPINRDLYHTSDALMEEIEALVNRHQDRLHMETFQSTNKGYHAELNVVTYCRNRTAIDDKSKFRILLSFGQHSRELITSELALRILSILSEEQFLPKMDPLLLNKALEKIVIKVVPLENLNGRKKVEAGDLCERRNGRGVDLNRNWSVDWGKKEKDFDPYEENPGTGPFSEPEAQLMRKLSMSFEPHIWVNVHSGMEALFMPYDHKNTTPTGLQSQKMRVMLETLNHLHCGDRCVVGSGGGSVGYLAHGTTTDYMFDVARVPMAFTFERVLNEWSATFFAMFNMEAHQMNDLQESTPFNMDHLISIDDYLNGYLIERKNRYGQKKEFIDLGLQEIRTYFRLFLLSSVMLMFMFCSRIAKSNRSHLPSISL
ncbi:Peptidase M14, carboxypeptidase A [Cynara cardunculus var. scolymus]|uniref:Peptidase M14, carboxypeptidase A n=1 Tax=Cynara cardunculus var. scolymus TaxID=59895 RepID=A0A103YER3_CYNCS|nr:Peptidase M14, carboxypeptidase A [Cynara cardunculus var. scolymus]